MIRRTALCKVGHIPDVSLPFIVSAREDIVRYGGSPGSATAFDQEIVHSLHEWVVIILQESKTSGTSRGRWTRDAHPIERVETASYYKPVRKSLFANYYQGLPVRHRAKSDSVQGETSEVFSGINSIFWTESVNQLLSQLMSCGRPNIIFTFPT